MYVIVKPSVEEITLDRSHRMIIFWAHNSELMVVRGGRPQTHNHKRSCVHLCSWYFHLVCNCFHCVFLISSQQFMPLPQLYVWVYWLCKYIFKQNPVSYFLSSLLIVSSSSVILNLKTAFNMDWNFPVYFFLVSGKTKLSIFIPDITLDSSHALYLFQM